MRRIFIALLILLGSVLQSTARADPSVFAMELDQLAKRKDLNELIKRIGEPKNAEEFRVGLDWLKAKSTSGFGGSRIAYLNALNLYRAGIGDSASLLYLVAMLSSRVDAARCADPTAPPEKIRQWETKLAPILVIYRALSFATQAELISIAVGWEEKIKTRAPDAWLCNGGLSFMLKFSKKHGSDASPPVREIEDKTRPGRTMLLDDPEIEPEFISDQEWLEKRAKVIANFIGQLRATK